MMYVPAADVKSLTKPLQICCDTLLIDRCGLSTQLCQSWLLQESWQMLVCIATDRTTGNDLNGLLNRFNLLCAKLLTGLKVRSLLFTRGSEVIKILLVCIAGAGCVFKVSFCISLGLESFRFECGLLIPV